MSGRYLEILPVDVRPNQVLPVSGFGYRVSGFTAVGFFGCWLLPVFGFTSTAPLCREMMNAFCINRLEQINHCNRFFAMIDFC